MARSSLPPGFRFHPTDVELIMYYLKKKLLGKKLSFEISELNIYKFSPWDLPDKSCMRSKDLEWFFFCPREKKYASGARTNRATESGYWKTTGKDRSVYYKDKVVGMIKTLVFHTGHAPNGERTDWVMHEYRFVDSDLANAGVSQDVYVLCKVFQKSGPGPKNGAQYGAPFNEEEWENDEVIAADSSAVHGLSPAAIVPFNNQNISPLTSMSAPHSACSWSLTEPGPSTAVPTANGAHTDVPVDDEIASLLDMFTEEPLLPTRSNNNEEFNNHNPGYVVEAVPCSDGNDIYTGLGDLAYSASLSGSGFNISNTMEDNFALNPMFQGGAFLELSDLETPIEFPAEAQLEQLPPIYITPSNIAVNYGNFDHGDNFNFLGTSQYPSPLNQLPATPEGSLWGNGSSMLQQEHGVQAAASQGHSYPLYHMDLASTGEREESSSIAAQAQIRGKQQRICYSRKVQQLLEPIPSHPASEVDQHFAAMCGRAHDNPSILGVCDSSDVKAEVTPGCGCGWCTKDALSMKLGESSSTSMSSFRCSLLYHGAYLQGDVAGCSNGFVRTIFLGLTTLTFSVVLIMKLEQTDDYIWSNLRNTSLSYLSKYLLLFNDWSIFIDSFLHRFLRIGFVLWKPQS